MEHRADVVIATRRSADHKQEAFKADATVSGGGKVELTVPLPSGTHVEVLILAPDEDRIEDLIQAARSSTDFWDNPLDDEDWNNA